MSHVCAYSGRRTDDSVPIMRANTAAAEIRHKILRKIRELENVSKTYGNCHRSLFELKEYIKGMTKRASAKKGGLGRK